MKVWKSPVFYFGILLVMAIAGLLAAPFVVDWNSYRADLESYGKKLTGRPVRIEGRISAQLFPWPQLTAEKISIANPPGLESPEFARADRITVRVTLAGLIRGGIDVESIDVENPEIGFERLATGEGNWLFTPSADPVRSDILSRVSLDQIRLRGGTVHFSDRRRGETITLDDFTASIASPGVNGPWRLQSAAVYNGRAVGIAVTTGIYAAGQPFRFGLRAASADGSGIVYSFDGAQDRGIAEGNLRIEPAATDDGKSDAEGGLRPLVFTAKVKATFDQVNLQSIEVSPKDPKDGGTLTTGSAILKLGRHIDARADLSSSLLDLDELTGIGSRNLLRRAGGLALAGSLLGMLPGEMTLSGGLKVAALKSGGETLDNVNLTLVADRNALRIGEFSTGLPGRSQMLFKGVYFPGDTGAELSGSVALESNDLRKLVLWAWPEGKDSLVPLWTGNRGRFKMQTELSVTEAQLRLSKAQYEINGEPGNAELSVTSAGRGAVDLRIDGKRIDVDSFMPQGISALPAVSSNGIGGLAALILPHADAPDLRLRLQAAELLLNGVTAANVALDLASSANGLDLRTLEIGSVGGARLEATGLILDSGKGADGSIGLDVKAEDPRELLRLLGIIKGGAQPSWAAGLGPTAVHGTLEVKPAEEGSTVSVKLDGTAGSLIIAGSGNVNAQMDISGEAAVSAANSGHLMTLLGLHPAVQDSDPGRIDIKAAGTVKDGYMASASMQAYGARFDYQGRVNPAASGFGLDGKIAIRSTEMRKLAEAMGLPARTPPEGVLVVDSTFKAEGGLWKFPDISGRLGGSKVSGAAELDSEMRLTGNIDAGGIMLLDVLPAVFLTWAGPAPDLETSFSADFPFGITGELWIRPSLLGIHPHFTAKDAEIGIYAGRGDIRLALFGKDATGRDALIEISSKGTDSSRKLEGKLSVPVDLANQLSITSGAAVAEGLGMVTLKFQAEGRSPGGALAGLRGSGAYDFDDFRLLGLTPSAFGRTLADAKDGAGITAAFDALRGGAGLFFGKIGGSITIANGEVTFLPFAIHTPEADVKVTAMAELALGEIDADISVALKVPADLPPMRFSYAGPPSALARSEENSELATKLGVTIMQKGIAELERLQQEQQRLAEQEEKQRIADEARLAAYYAQRDELILRKRELKIHAEMRLIAAERLRAELEAERAANAEISKGELKQRAREIRVFRRQARLSTATPKPKPEPPAQVAAQPALVPVPQTPVILAEPEGAPVVISPEPGAAPSQ